jgi:hypothetical protein
MLATHIYTIRMDHFSLRAVIFVAKVLLPWLHKQKLSYSVLDRIKVDGITPESL